MAKEIHNSIDTTENISPGEQHLDRKWAWVVMVSALMTHILTFGVAYASVGALYVEFLNEFGKSESATALTGSIMIGTMLCSGRTDVFLLNNLNILGKYIRKPKLMHPHFKSMTNTQRRE